MPKFDNKYIEVILNLFMSVFGFHVWRFCPFPIDKLYIGVSNNWLLQRCSNPLLALFKPTPNNSPFSPFPNKYNHSRILTLSIS